MANIILVLTPFVLTYALLLFLESRLCKHVPGEPPFVRSSVPVFGHIIGLMRHGVSYYRQLREKTNLPIFTMCLGPQKVYIVNSPALISQINRRPKQIDTTPPFLNIVLGKLFGCSGDDLAELMKNPTQKGSLRRDSKDLEHNLLERGMSSLDELFTGIMSGLADEISAAARSGPTSIQLHAWLRDIFTKSTANCVYGPNNPFARDSELLDSFWEFESGLKWLTMGVFPSLTAAGPARARQRLIDGFKAFVDDGAVKNGETSAMIRELTEVAYKHNRGTEYLARYFFGVFCAFMLNTVPVTFWTIGKIVEDPELLARIRAELAEVIVEPSSVDAKVTLKKLQVDVALIREKCPLLVSTFQESLRYVGASTSTMLVHDDVFISEQYLLKKGSLVQISTTAVHSDPAIWGSNAAEFEPERFMKKTAKQVHPAANRTFGGGSMLCPGRHLASDEVLAFTAMFLHGFETDFTTTRPCLPRRDDTNMLSVTKPVDDMGIIISRRPSMANVSWSVRTKQEKIR